MKIIPLQYMKQTYEQAIQEILKQTTAYKICFKCNLLAFYVEEKSKDIIDFVTSNLITLDQEKITGYSATLLQLMKQFSKQFSVYQVFSCIQQKMVSSKENKFGAQKMMRLVCILCCFQAAIYAGAKFDVALQLFTQTIKEKMGKFNQLASQLVLTVLKDIKQYGDASEFILQFIEGYESCKYLLDLNKEVDESQIVNAVYDACLYANYTFLQQIIQYLKGKQSVVLKIFDNIVASESPSQYIPFLSFIAQLELSPVQKSEMVQKLFSQSTFESFTFELVSPKAPLNKDFVSFFTHIFTLALLHSFIVRMIKETVKSHELFTSKAFTALVSGLNQDLSKDLFMFIIKLINTNIEPLQYMHALLQLSSRCTLHFVYSFIQQILNRIGFCIEVTKNAVDIDIVVPEQYEANYQKLIWQIILVQNEHQAIIYHVSAILIEQFERSHNVAHQQMTKIFKIFNDLHVHDQTEVTSDLLNLNEGMKEILSQYVILTVVFPKIQVVGQFMLELVQILSKLTYINNNFADINEYDSISNQFYDVLGRVLLKMAQIEGQIPNNFGVNVARYFANNCADQLFDTLMLGVDLQNNCVTESFFEEDDLEEQEQEEELSESNSYNDYTDQFSYSKQEKLSDHAEIPEEVEEAQEVENQLMEVEGEPSKKSLPVFKEPTDEEYDRVLVNYVQSIIQKKSGRQLQMNLKVGLQSLSLLEVLIEQNPGRPMIWECLFSLIKIGTNPLESVKLQQKLSLEERKTLVVFQQKCLNMVQKSYLKDLKIDDLFDGKQFVVEEDVNFAVKILMQGQKEQKRAASTIIIQVLSKLMDNHYDIAAPILDFFAENLAQKKKVLPNFVEQMMQCEKTSNILIVKLLKRFEIANESKLSLLNDINELAKMAKIKDGKEIQVQLFECCKRVVQQQENSQYKQLNQIFELQKKVGPVDGEIKERYAQLGAKGEAEAIIKKIIQ